MFYLFLLPDSLPYAALHSTCSPSQFTSTNSVCLFESTIENVRFNLLLHCTMSCSKCTVVIIYGRYFSGWTLHHAISSAIHWVVKILVQGSSLWCHSKSAVVQEGAIALSAGSPGSETSMCNEGYVCALYKFDGISTNKYQRGEPSKCLVCNVLLTGNPVIQIGWHNRFS